MGLKENVDAVRKDVAKHAPNFFIYFFEKYPHNQAHFPDYVGKSMAELKAMPKFNEHTQKVVNGILDIMGRAAEKSQLKDDAQKMIDHPKHGHLKAQQFEDLFAALVPYLQQTLGGACAADAWKTAGSELVAEMKAKGFQ